MEAIARELSSFPLLWIVEDDHGGFSTGRGPIAIVGIRTDGWTFEPMAVFFKWARPRNILRAGVAFFSMIRRQKDVGVCLVRCLKKDLAYMKHMEEYRVIYQRARIPFGSPAGDVFVFSINGAKVA